MSAVSLLTPSQADRARHLWRDRFFDACDDLEACALDRPGLEGPLILSRVEQARTQADGWWRTR